MAYFSIISETHPTQSNPDNLYEFMGDFNNFKHLLPEDKIDNFKCTSDECFFDIKGLVPLTIKIKEKTPKTKITFETVGLAKFVFTLHIHLLPEQKTNVQIEGDMNHFIKMMVEKPLSDLVNTMAKKLAGLSV